MNDSRPPRWIRVGAVSMAVAMGLFLGGSPACAASKTTEGVKWYGYEEGMRRARESNRPILLHFYTDWCTWCKKMERDNFSKPRIQEALNQGFVPIRINPESKERIRVEGGREIKASELARQFGVRGFPTTIFLESDGSPIAPLPGYIDPDSMRKVLGYVREKAYQKMTFDEYTRQGS